MEADPVLATVIAVVALLLIAAAAAVGLKRLRFPFTVGLVLVGIVLGGLQSQVGALHILSSFSLSPDLILFVFLPTLIFESAFNMDVRLLSRNLAPVLTLAAPGLVISTFIVAALVHALTPLTLGPALVFGALISATDPVSVIALFREVGAPKRLAILVEGESLFNDATAIVLFTILLAMVVEGPAGGGGVSQGLVAFLRVFVGGLTVGVIAGYLMVLTISLAEDEPLVEVAFSTVAAYAAFITAEHYLEVSGVMATVGAGVMVGALGSTRFTPDLKAYLRQFWAYASFVANSLIFLLVGLSISIDMLADHAGPIGWAILAVLLARAVTVFGLVPIVNRLPNAEPVNLRYQGIMYWGGLRGAVALALALSLPTTFVFRDLMLALTIGIVLFTLLSGGITMGPLIRALGLDRPGVVDLVARAQGVVASKRKALDRVEGLGTAGRFSARIIASLAKRYRQELDHAHAQLDDLCTGSDFQSGTMRQVLLTQALTVERRTYQEFFAQGRISEAVLHELDLSVDLERDALRRGVTSVMLPMAEPLEVRVAGFGVRFLERFAPTSTAVLRHRVRTLAANYERDSAVHAASERVIGAIRHLAELAKVDGAVEAACREIYEERAARAMERIDSLAEHFPEYASAVQERTARRIALDAEADAVEELAAAGELPDSVAREARQRVEAAQRDLARRPVTPMTPDPEELLTKVPFFKELSLADFQRVAEALVPRTVLPHERIIKQGERGTSLFLIARGVVAVIVAKDGAPPRRVASLHAGDFFGEMALLSDDPRNATVEAVTACQLYELAKADVDGLCEVCEGVKQALTAAAIARKVSTARSGDR